MNELLEKLLASDLLTEETKVDLQEAITKQITEMTEKARQDATISVTAELNEQWISERETLIEAIDSKVTEALTDEIKELRIDIDRFRDLEAEHAVKIAEAKSDMSETVKRDLAQLIEKLDSFLEIRIAAELDELQEDIIEVKKNTFGRKIFETFAIEFQKFNVVDDSAASKLVESERRLDDAINSLEQSEKRMAKLERSIKMESVLSPLQGRSKEVMEAILKSVDTALLEDAYKTYIGRVLKESLVDEKTSEKETTVLAEDVSSKKIKGIVKKGDDAERLNEDVISKTKEQQIITMSQDDKNHLRRLAGL